jgi:MinD superfamily P-loop ATPase
MREIIVISGKGGTGKTSLTGAFAHLASAYIICDLDVDAPDLHLLLQPTPGQQEDFYSGFEAQIDPEKCTGCGLCASLCQFGAIRNDEAGFTVDRLRR